MGRNGSFRARRVGAQAEPSSDLIPVLLKNGLQLKAVGDQTSAAQERVKASWGDYYPQAKLTGWAGYEEYRADGGTNRHTPAKSADASLTQLIYDFGLTGSKIATAASSSICWGRWSGACTRPCGSAEPSRRC